MLSMVYCNVKNNSSGLGIGTFFRLTRTVQREMNATCSVALYLFKQLSPYDNNCSCETYVQFMLSGDLYAMMAEVDAPHDFVP